MYSCSWSSSVSCAVNLDKPSPSALQNDSAVDSILTAVLGCSGSNPVHGSSPDHRHPLPASPAPSDARVKGPGQVKLPLSLGAPALCQVVLGAPRVSMAHQRPGTRRR